MRRLGILLALIGILGTTGVCFAGEEEHGKGQMPPAVKAAKEKYHERRQKLQEECKQKMHDLEQQENAEMQALMKAKHEQHMKEEEEKYQKHLQEMQKKTE